jgi:phosphatidylinositol 4-phosphatase
MFTTSTASNPMDQAVKRLLAKASNIKAFIPTKFTQSAPLNTATATTHAIGLPPSHVLPPVPHPRPHDHLALLVTNEGLLLRPHFEGPTSPASHIRISWENPAKVEELVDEEGSGIDWNESVIIYGIVGILELFSCSLSFSSFLDLL